MLMMAQSTDVQANPIEFSEPRPWRCATGTHVLGVVKRSNNERRLYLASGHILAGSAEVWCPACLAFREWHAGADALEHLLRRRSPSEPH